MFLPHLVFFRPTFVLELAAADEAFTAVVEEVVAVLSLAATPPQAASTRAAEAAQIIETRA